MFEEDFLLSAELISQSSAIRKNDNIQQKNGNLVEVSIQPIVSNFTGFPNAAGNYVRDANHSDISGDEQKEEDDSPPISVKPESENAEPESVYEEPLQKSVKEKQEPKSPIKLTISKSKTDNTTHYVKKNNNHSKSTNLKCGSEKNVLNGGYNQDSIDDSFPYDKEAELKRALGKQAELLRNIMYLKRNSRNKSTSKKTSHKRSKKKISRKNDSKSPLQNTAVAVPSRSVSCPSKPKYIEAYANVENSAYTAIKGDVVLVTDIGKGIKQPKLLPKPIGKKENRPKRIVDRKVPIIADHSIYENKNMFHPNYKEKIFLPEVANRYEPCALNNSSIFWQRYS